MEVGFLGLKYPSVILVDNAAWRPLKDNCSSCVHHHLMPSHVSCLRGLVIRAKYLMNLEQDAAELRRLCTSDTLVGGATLEVLRLFLGQMLVVSVLVNTASIDVIADILFTQDIINPRHSFHYATVASGTSADSPQSVLRKDMSLFKPGKPGTGSLEIGIAQFHSCFLFKFLAHQPINWYKLVD
ncbi:hypothetical protein ACROYT_G013873 [Oculina patagonica]